MHMQYIFEVAAQEVKSHDPSNSWHPIIHRISWCLYYL